MLFIVYLYIFVRSVTLGCDPVRRKLFVNCLKTIIFDWHNMNTGLWRQLHNELCNEKIHVLYFFMKYNCQNKIIEL